MSEVGVAKENFFKRFFRSLKAEWKKITWPTGAQLIKQAVVVVVLSLILCLFIRLIDFGAGKLIEWVGQLF